MSKVYFWYENNGEGGQAVGRIFSNKETAITEAINEFCTGSYGETMPDESKRNYAWSLLYERELE